MVHEVQTMNIIEIILNKKNKHALTKEEIHYFVKEYAKQNIADYQISALLMAISLNGMNEFEVSELTKAMIESGEHVDLSLIKGIKVDKHSTGGVGDKTSLVLAPLVAAAGAKVAKMSGRGLGHTGGTLDKLEAIPGFQIEKTKEDFIKQVNEIGIAIIGQSANLVPADKKLYALRDVTGTIDSIPLIASSIMSKKIATGSDAICLDVKFGSGAFFEKIEDSIQLAQEMVRIGKSLNRHTVALLTDMDQPLGYAIGNTIEVLEAIDTLNGVGPKDLLELCLEAGSIMLMQAQVVASKVEAMSRLQEVISNKTALRKLKEMVRYQGGDVSYIENPTLFKKAKYCVEVFSVEEGFVKKINALALGEIAMLLGAGRAKKEDLIDFAAGILLNKKIGDFVKKGEVLANFYTNKEQMNDLSTKIASTYQFSSSPVKTSKIVHHILE